MSNPGLRPIVSGILYKRKSPSEQCCQIGSACLQVRNNSQRISQKYSLVKYPIQKRLKSMLQVDRSPSNHDLRYLKPFALGRSIINKPPAEKDSRPPTLYNNRLISFPTLPDLFMTQSVKVDTISHIQKIVIDLGSETGHSPHGPKWTQKKRKEK